MNGKFKQYFQKIIQNYNRGTATTEEINFLEKYYDTFEMKEDLVTDENEAEFLHIKQSITNKINRQIGGTESKVISIKTSWIKYAAAALVLVSLSVAYHFTHRAANKATSQNNAAQLILPGGNKAMLTLADGKKIPLDNAHNGKIASQSNISISKINGNQIVYIAAGDTAANGQQAYLLHNTISTPNGGQYALVLPDGTKVTLNAASSITYPVAFHGKERLVQLNGEGYFEVAKNKAMPFKVQSGRQVVEVLGTHFNINAYADEAKVKTTLVEGSVKVTMGASSTMIVPGQQAATNRSGAGEVLKYTVDVDKETAWKSGLFSFRNDDIRSVMRQVARWYDVKIVYTDNIPRETFSGEISRTSNLSDVFKILELNNIHFQVEGKTVTVSAK